MKKWQLLNARELRTTGGGRCDCYCLEGKTPKQQIPPKVCYRGSATDEDECSRLCRQTQVYNRLDHCKTTYIGGILNKSGLPPC